METASAADTSSSLVVLGSTIAETSASADTTNSTNVIAAIVSEAANASDTLDTTPTFLSAIVEVLVAVEIVNDLASGTSVVTEAVTALDSLSSNAVLPSTIRESATAADAVTLTSIDRQGTIAEHALAFDTLSAGIDWTVGVSELAESMDIPSVEVLGLTWFLSFQDVTPPPNLQGPGNLGKLFGSFHYTVRPPPAPLPRTLRDPSMPQNLQAILHAQAPGATVTLTGGFDDQAISNLTFSPKIRVIASPATFRSLSISSCVGIDFVGLNCNFSSPAPQSSNLAAIRIANSSHIGIYSATIVGTTATNGAALNATAQDPTGNVQGLPCGEGINTSKCDYLTISRCDISNVDRGIVLDCPSSSIDHNHIHNLRRTAILGTPGANTVIEVNHTHDINPWHWGHTEWQGDHADHIALWVAPADVSPVSGVIVRWNLMETGAGIDVLGNWFQDNATFVGFDAPQIIGNVGLIANTQALALRGCTNPVVSDNIYLLTSGDPAHQTPIIFCQPRTSGASGSANVVASVDYEVGGMGNSIGIVPPPYGVASPGLIATARHTLDGK